MKDNCTEYKTSPCVGSGLCCKAEPCGFGEWDSINKRCKYLQDGNNDVTIYRCGRYEYIKQQPGNEFMPAFGAGCCMSMFNTDRQKIIQEIKVIIRKVIQFLK